MSVELAASWVYSPVLTGASLLPQPSLKAVPGSAIFQTLLTAIYTVCGVLFSTAMIGVVFAAWYGITSINE